MCARENEAYGSTHNNTHFLMVFLVTLHCVLLIIQGLHWLRGCETIISMSFSVIVI